MDSDDRYTRITLRLPKDLHAKLMQAAAERSHSMNAEIVARLEESFDRPAVTEQAKQVGDMARTLTQMMTSIQGKLEDLHSKMVEARQKAAKAPQPPPE